jgi:CNT family concentrative nucleoside transporter
MLHLGAGDAGRRQADGPRDGYALTAGGVQFKVERLDANIIDAATRGTTEGMALAINVGAMLITFTALVAMLNAMFAWICGKFGLPDVTMASMLGYVMAPLAWLAGVSLARRDAVGSLLGVKTVLNEFIAYLEMSKNSSQDPNYLSPRSALIAVYALCGFANFASVGIQIGGISTMAPDRGTTSRASACSRWSAGRSRRSWAHAW